MYYNVLFFDFKQIIHFDLRLFYQELMLETWYERLNCKKYKDFFNKKYLKALAHIKAMTSVEALSNRHMLIANKEANTMQEYAQWLKEEFEPKGYSICTRVAPNFLLKLYR